MKTMTIGRNGWYKVIQTKDGMKAMYQSLDKEEFLENRANPTLREYLNYTNLYDASGIVAFTLGKERVVPSNRYHLSYLLRKIQIEIFGTSDIEDLLISEDKFEQLNAKYDELSSHELAILGIFRIDQAFRSGLVLEECCNIGGVIKFDDFNTLFWVYEMLLQKAIKNKIAIEEDKQIKSFKFEEFTENYPNLQPENLF